MIYFSLNGEHDNEENFHVNVSFQSETLGDVVSNFEYFLRGLGYQFDRLEIVNDESNDFLDTGGSTTSYALDPSYDVQPLSTMNTDTIRPLTIDDLKVMNLNTK